MRKLSISILYSFMGEILLFAFSFLLGVLTARFLGPAGRGSFWILFNGAGLLTIIFSMRFRQSITYHLSKNRAMLREIVLYGLLVGIGMTVCVAIIATVFSSILYSTLLKGIGTSWAIVTLICFSYYLWTLIISVLEGLMLFNAKALFMGGSYLLKCILVVVGIIHFEFGFDSLVLLLGIVETIGYSTLLVILLLRAPPFHIDISLLRSMLRYSAGALPGTLSDFYTLRIDAFVLNYFAGATEVGIYSVAVSLATMLLYIPASLKSVLMPYIASFADKEITARLCRLLFLVMSVMGVILIPLIWIAVIPLYGATFSFSRTLFLILFPGSVFWGIFLLLASDIEGRGFPWRVSMVSMMTALSAVILSLILIPTWNSPGAAIVSSITQGISMMLGIRLYKRIIGGKVEELLVPKMEELYSYYKLISEFAVHMRKALLSTSFGRRPMM